MFFNKLLSKVAALLYFFLTIVYSQSNDLYLSDTNHWYGKGVTKKVIGTNYRLEARNQALAEIASQISSTIVSNSNFQLSIKNGKTKKDVYIDNINTFVNATIEFDVEDVSQGIDGKEYYIILKLSKEKYFENRNIKRENAIKKAVTVLENIEPYPTKSSLNNLNEIFQILLPYADEDLNYILSDGNKINLLSYSATLARNFIDKISVEYELVKYPLYKLNEDFEFIIRVFDRSSGTVIDSFNLLNLKNNKTLIGDGGLYKVKGKISRKNSYNYELNLETSLPGFIIFDLENKFFSFDNQYFKKQKNPTITLFHVDANDHPVPRFGFELITKDILNGFKKDFKSSIYQVVDNSFDKDNIYAPIELGKKDKLSDFVISTEIIYDDFEKNQYGRYVCFINAEFSFYSLRNNKSVNYTLSEDIRGISALSKNDAIRDALEKVNDKYGKEIYNEFKKTLIN